MRTGDDVALVTADELFARCVDTLVAAGASDEQASALATATVEAERFGRRNVGVAHLLDYCEGLREGRIVAGATPQLSVRSDVVAHVDCRKGLAQHGFESALPWLTAASRTHGLAVACLSDCFTAGEIGHYVRRLTDHGLIGLALANSPALMAVADSCGPLLGTNPLAFGVPLPDGAALAVDQASSATAWVSVRDAAALDRPLEPGTAVDAEGRPTTSAAAALDGALLPFGGYKGGNIALLVEVLAALAGGTFSCEAAPFDRGDRSPSIGLFVLALSPSHFDPGFAERLRDQLRHWDDEHGARTRRWTPTPMPADAIEVSSSVLAQLVEEADRNHATTRG